MSVIEGSVLFEMCVVDMVAQVAISTCSGKTDIYIYFFFPDSE